MKVKSNVKSGAISTNHNQTAAGLRAKSKVEAGGDRITPNHSRPVAL